MLIVVTIASLALRQSWRLSSRAGARRAAALGARASRCSRSWRERERRGGAGRSPSTSTCTTLTCRRGCGSRVDGLFAARGSTSCVAAERSPCVAGARWRRRLASARLRARSRPALRARRVGGRAAVPRRSLRQTNGARSNCCRSHTRRKRHPDDHRARPEPARRRPAVEGTRDRVPLRRRRNVSSRAAARRSTSRCCGRATNPAFVISVPVTAPVARYRVGFRGEDGRIIGHVDRRGSRHDESQEAPS